MKSIASRHAKLPCSALLASLPESLSLLSHGCKAAVAEQASEVSGRLDFASSEPFMEPLLHGYFSLSDPQISIDQLLLAHVNPAERPSRISVRSDAEGFIYFPGLGRVRAPLGSQDYFLDASLADYWRLSCPLMDVRVTVEPALLLPRPIAELPDRADPITEKVLLEECGATSEIAISPHTNDTLHLLGSALNLMEKASPDLREAVDLVTRRIVLFDGRNVDSFATNRLFGAVFLQACSASSVPFFLEELSHQCGHLVLSALTLCPGEYYRNPPTASLVEFGEQSSEYRSVETLFHAAFTESAL